MDFTKSEKKFLITLVLIVILMLIYTRYRPFEKIMPGFYDKPVIKCEAIYCEQIVEDGKLTYKTIIKEFDVMGGEYSNLMSILENGKYKKQMIPAFIGGKRQSYSIPYPYAEIRFYQQENEFVFNLYNRCLPAGRNREIYDYTPKGNRKFYNRVYDFIINNGKTVKEEIREY